MVRQMSIGVLTYKKSVKFKNCIRFWNGVSKKAYKRGCPKAGEYFKEVADDLQKAFTFIKQGKPLEVNLKKRVRFHKNLKEFA